MRFFSKKKTHVLPDDLDRIKKELSRSEAEKLFYFNAVRSLLVFLKQFPLNLKEINTSEFIAKIDDLMQKLVEEENISRQDSALEKSKKQIFNFITRHKQCLENREKEFKEIIELLTKTMVDFGIDNQEYNDEIFEKTDKIGKLTELDDIKLIKSSINQEVTEIKQAVSEKQKKDTRQIAVLSDKVSALEKELQKAESKSLRDGLTGIYNRLAFDRQIKNMLDNQAISNGRFSLLMIDIDDFKPINDQYGHQVGDRVILAVVKKVSSFVRSDDFTARYGGEEFSVILSGTNLKNATKKAKQICKSLSSTRYALSPGSDRQISVTVSIGVAVSRIDDTEESVVKRADTALYKAKNSGKNCVASEKEL